MGHLQVKIYRQWPTLHMGLTSRSVLWGRSRRRLHSTTSFQVIHDGACCAKVELCLRHTRGVRQPHFAWDKHGVSLHMCIQRLGIFNTLSYLHYNSIRTQINDECSLSGALVYCTLIHDIQCLSQESRSLQSQPSDWPCLQNRL